MDVEAVIRRRLSDFELHCATKSDHLGCAWLFAGGPLLPVRRGHQSFADGGATFSIHILDLYHARHPTLINLATIKYRHNPRYRVRSYLILDSNVASYICQYAAGRMTDPAKGHVVSSFLAHVLRERLDPSPVFYLIESLARFDLTLYAGQSMRASLPKPSFQRARIVGFGHRRAGGHMSQGIAFTHRRRRRSVPVIEPDRLMGGRQVAMVSFASQVIPDVVLEWVEMEARSSPRMVSACANYICPVADICRF